MAECSDATAPPITPHLIVPEIDEVPSVPSEPMVTAQATPSPPVLSSPETVSTSSPDHISSPPTPVAQPVSVSDEPLGRGHRQKKAPAKMKEFVANTVVTTSVPCDTRHSTLYPIGDYVDCQKFSETHKAFLAAITSVEEPSSYKKSYT